MTVQQLHDAFKLGFDKVDSFAYPNFISSEIDTFLNQAQERIVKQRLGINNNKKQGFEETQKRTDDLRELVKAVSISPSAVSTDNKPLGRFYELPSDYWLTVQEEYNSSYVDCGTTVTKRVPVKPIQHDDYNKIIKDPFNKPSNDEVLRLMLGGYTELLVPTPSSASTYYLRYIKKPQTINLATSVTSELSDLIHLEIVDEAVSIALETIESSRVQTFPIIKNTNE